MNAIIKSPQPKIEIEKFIYNPNIVWYSTNDLKIMRIELDENYTRIDFVHYANRKYKNGGWVRINQDTFIRPTGTDTKLNLLKAVNIPVAPATHHYKSEKDCLFFSLYFPSLSKDITQIDIVEEGVIHHSRFRFYEVSVAKIRSKTFIIAN